MQPWVNTHAASLTAKKSRSVHAKTCTTSATKTASLSNLLTVRSLVTAGVCSLPAEDHIKPGDYSDPYFRGDGKVWLNRATVVGDNGEDEEIVYTPMTPNLPNHPARSSCTTTTVC